VKIFVDKMLEAMAQGTITTSQGAIMKERLKKDLKAGR